MAGVAGRSGRLPLAKPNLPQTGPINAIEVQPSGKLRSLTCWGGKGLADVRMVFGRFLLSFQDLWERRGDEILDRVADEHPELILLSQIKLASVMRIEVGAPGGLLEATQAGDRGEAGGARWSRGPQPVRNFHQEGRGPQGWKGRGRQQRSLSRRRNSRRHCSGSVSSTTRPGQSLCSTRP
jgi:hypothetical protein